jgi:predicted peptidase
VPDQTKNAVSGFLFQTLDQGGKEYKYTVYAPRDYTADKAWPLIVFLNGYGECGTDGQKHLSVGLPLAVMRDAEKWPFVIALPQKPKHEDAWEDHDAAVMAMVKQAQADYNVDATRLYLTGLSQGGHGTWAIGALHPNLWAAMAPVCGYGKAEEIGPPLKDMPIWNFHGDADTAVPLERSEELIAAVKKAGGTPKNTVYPGVGHNSWDNAYQKENLPDWFLSHQRANPEP